MASPACPRLRRPAHGTRSWLSVVVALVTLAAGLLAAAGPACGAAVEQLVRGELLLRSALQARDRGVLLQLHQDRELPGTVRGRALLALITGQDGRLQREERVRLLEALEDPAPEVRAAAVQLVQRFSERPLERALLKRVAEDPDPRVRVKALVAVRGWTRQGHLYFLDQALVSPWPEVHQEVLRNLASLSYREVSPELIEQVRAAARPEVAPAVRRHGLAVLQRWGLLQWPELQAVVAEPAVGEELRLHALELSDALGQTPGRDEVLRDILGGGESLRLVWAAYQRLAASPQGADGLPGLLIDYLAASGQNNSATQDMARHLEKRGYRAEYRSGEWEITRRRPQR